MKVAVVGSRNLNIKSIKYYIPAAATEIVSGGAKGVDAAAEKSNAPRRARKNNKVNIIGTRVKFASLFSFIPPRQMQITVGRPSVVHCCSAERE